MNRVCNMWVVGMSLVGCGGLSDLSQWESPGEVSSAPVTEKPEQSDVAPPATTSPGEKPLLGPCLNDWSIDRVATVTAAPQLANRSVSIALDASQSVHIAFGDGALLRHAQKNVSTGWVLHTVTGALDRNSTLSMAIDAQDRVQIAFQASASGLQHASHSASVGWSTKAIDGSGWDGFLTKDARSEVRLAYIRDWTVWYGALGVNGGNGGNETWSTESLGISTQRFPSIAYDLEGLPHLVHLSSDWHLRYAHRQRDGVWLTSQITDELVYTMPGFVLDAGGHPHVSYSSQTGLHHATLSAPNSWLDDTIEMRAPGLGTASALAVDSHGGVHIAYTMCTFPQCPTGQIHHMARTTVYSNRETEVVDAPSTPVLAFSIVTDAQEHIHLGFSTREDVRHAVRRTCP